MSARWHESGREPRRGPRNDAGNGPGASGACLFLGFVAVYMGLHIAIWVGRVVIA